MVNIIKDNLYLAFNYSNKIYIQNLVKKIKLSELENYIKHIFINIKKLKKLTLIFFFDTIALN